ncbi:MAG: ferritin-like domain-containing protein [Bryobacteraceae bacterium]
MERKSILPEVIAQAPNRRSFVRKLGIASAAASVALMVRGKGGLANAASSPGPTTTDVEVLQFALNLEYLEAEFYTVATSGKTIDMAPYSIPINGMATGSNPTSGGAVTNGSQVTFSNSLVFTSAVAQQIADDERAHVMLIRDTLSSNGVEPIAQPNINLNALGFGFGSQDDFLKLARIFEDIGVTAYGGAAPLLSSAVIGTAARILATEAEHVANIRLQVARLNIPTTPALDSVDILPPPSGSQYFSVGAKGLTQVRTPGQVLYLAYGMKSNAVKGGFFPTGANGTITESSGPA